MNHGVQLNVAVQVNPRVVDPRDPVPRLQARLGRGITVHHPRNSRPVDARKADHNHGKHISEQKVEHRPGRDDGNPGPDILFGKCVGIVVHHIRIIRGEPEIIAQKLAGSAERNCLERIPCPVFHKTEQARAESDREFDHAHAIQLCQKEMPPLMDDDHQPQNQNECQYTERLTHFPPFSQKLCRKSLVSASVSRICDRSGSSTRRM